MKGSTPISTSVKEKEPTLQLAEREEEIKIQEAQERAEIAKELEPYIKHVETEPEISHEMSQIGVVNPAQAATQVLDEGPTIVLPLSQEEVKQGLIAPVWKAIRWLAEWSIRITKIATRHGIKVIFRRGGDKESVDT
jgi:hypothetical protein